MSCTIEKFETAEIEKGFGNFVKHFPEYVEYAQVLSNEAESYKNFEVGAIIAAIKPGDDELMIVPGSNYTPNHAQEDKKSYQDILMPEYFDEQLDEIGSDLHEQYRIPTRIGRGCAETSALLKLEEYEEQKLFKGDLSLYVLGVIVVGSRVKKEIIKINKGVETKTLPPCVECTEVLSKHNSTSKATIYASTGFLPSDIFELRTIQNLRRLHHKKVDDLQGKKTEARLHPNIGKEAYDIFSTRIAHTALPEKLPSRIISAIAKNALIEAGQVD